LEGAFVVARLAIEISRTLEESAVIDIKSACSVLYQNWFSNSGSCKISQVVELS